ncbi:HYExAFE family protein [Botrimarina hoheduenensis]|uniref:Uncharacterized protein n=1 Tax=Botrimarina hoheduenensis TaxID=2528000 RepID=A0A5C5W6H1_9BACT|nr:HYExAFE family protein [Botrimarina hoheduenensis]TWT46518.1 hypothetical protein Pla111_16140 [Botrimarina hoheduenensis]
MAKRHNHYEAAFEAYLRAERIAYVAVNEQRRALAPHGSLKSVDFLISTDQPAGSGWLVDVKGRQFPSGHRSPQYWRNWTTRDELDSLRQWSDRFGDRFEGVLLFAYELVADRAPVSPERVFYHADRPYAFVGVRAADYAAAARPLSAKWDTVSVPVARFRQLAAPADELLADSLLI